jgi:hypothetical protein
MARYLRGKKQSPEAKRERVLFLQGDNIFTKFGVQKPPKLPLRKTPGEFWQLAQVD